MHGDENTPPQASDPNRQHVIASAVLSFPRRREAAIRNHKHVIPAKAGIINPKATGRHSSARPLPEKVPYPFSSGKSTIPL